MTTHAPEPAGAARGVGAADGTRMHPLTLRFPDAEEVRFRADYFDSSLKLVRVALLLATFLYAVFGVLDNWIVPEVRNTVWVIRYGIVCPFFVLVYGLSYLPSFRRSMQWALMSCILIGGVGIVAIIQVAPSPGNSPYYAGLILCIMYAYTQFRLRFVYATACSVVLVAAYNVPAVCLADMPAPVLINNNFFLVTAIVIGLFANYTMEQYVRRDYLLKAQLTGERVRSEQLLLNILPPAIADRLKRQPGMIVDNFAEATVLFADMAGFTALSSRLRPEEVVTLLNDLFCLLDRLAERHGLEKVKTIGDAYMLVGGIPSPRTDHTEAVAAMALDMQAEIDRLELPGGGKVRLRIGIHTGPVIAGVIGTKKFCYDLWGDTVNTASRMESHGTPDHIQVSRATYERLKHGYEFGGFRTISIKGKGEMSVCYLTGRARAGNEPRPAPTSPGSGPSSGSGRSG